jgi:hypothetical protein
MFDLIKRLFSFAPPKDNNGIQRETNFYNGSS